MNRYQKNRKVINRCALALLVFVTVLLAIPTFGVSLLALVCPKAVLAGAALTTKGLSFMAGKLFLFGATAPANPPASLPLMPYRYQEPIVKISPVNLGKPVTWELPLGKRICTINLNVTVTGSATGNGATKTIPRPSWGLGEIRFNLGNTNRRRTAAQLFGYRGLNAINSMENGGTVQYFQGNPLVAITATLNGFSYGNEPVLIDSPEDVALQGALANNTATVAVFNLPLIFAEDFRKDPAMGEAMALPTGFDDGSILGKVIVEADVPAATGVAGTMTAVAVDGSLLYDEQLAKAGSIVYLSKEKIHQKMYGAGDIELGDQFCTQDILQRFSLLCAGDKITKVVVKQGSRIIRNVTFANNHLAMRVSQVNGRSVLANRFDIELDLNDDPKTALPLNKLQDFSVVATFSTTNDVPLNCLILATYYGPVE